jgi:hypothetical protein
MIYWQGKTEELGEKPVPVPLCPPQIPHGLTRAWTQASAVRGRRLTTWAMARPLVAWLVKTFSPLLWNSKVGCPVHKNPLLVPILNQKNPALILKLYFLGTQFDVILLYVSQVGHRFQVFRPKLFMNYSLLPCVPYVQPILYTLMWSS